MFKVLAVLGFVAVASAADLTVGAQGGKLIFEKNVTASPAIWRQVLNVTVNSTNPEEVIGGIVVIDNRPEKNGEATVVEGGEGEKNVTIELKSPTVLRGFDFSIKVFAREENENARSPNQPTPIEDDTQNPQEPKDVNSNQEPKNGVDIIIGTQQTASSSTEANKDDQVPVNPALVGKDQVPVNPALVGKDQVRQSRDTVDQATKDQTSDDATKDADKPEQPEVVETDSQQETDSEKVLPVKPQGEDEVDVHEHKEEETTTVQAESTTEAVSTTEEVTTEAKSEDHHHHHGHHHHAVPLPYAN